MLKAGPPDDRIGAGETLNLGGNPKIIRIAPCRFGEPVASFWRVWMRGDELYAAGRSHIGVHKLSFHRNGKWYTTLRDDRKELAPGKLLPGGRWRHAMQLRYLVGDRILPPLPEKSFSESKAGHMIEIPPGEYLVTHLLIGTEGTTLETPLPDGYGFPCLLPLELRSGGCAVLVGGPMETPPDVQRDLAMGRAIRIQMSRPPDLTRDSLEIFGVEITEHGFNRVSVIPLGPENFTITPRPPGAKGVDVDWFHG